MKILLFLTTYIYLAHCNIQTNNRIIGGEPVYVGQFRFLAAIYKTTPDGNYFCAGSLLNQRWILTAGQCVDGATSFTIYLGTTNIKKLDSTALKLATEEYVLHPEYDPLTVNNDIGLIKLRMDITYTDDIFYVPLPWADVGENEQGLRAIGWGQTSDETTELADELQWVTLTSISNQECKVVFGDQITDSMVCVVGNYNEGTCHGDTGSPLVYLYRGAYIHQGVASFVGFNGCESTDPSGFTRTFPYLDWINNVTSV